MRRSTGTEGEILWQAGQSETYTDGPCHSGACPSLRWVSTGAHQGGILKYGVWSANPGRGLLLASSAPATSEADSGGRNTCRDGLKPQLSPSGWMTKEELKSFLIDV